MSEYAGTPNIRKRIIGSALLRARKAAGLTVDQVCDKLALGPSSLRRQEYGQTAVSVADVQAYAKLYEFSDTALELRLTGLAKHARARGWWSTYDGTVGPTLIDLADIEDIATGIRTWQPLLIPGLLQTADYSAAIIQARRGFTSNPETLPIEDSMELRERRKTILDRKQPPEIWAIVGEAALRTPVGGPGVMEAQLQQLLDLSMRPNISLQIMPFAAGVHAGMGGAFMVCSFDSSLDGSITYIENTGGDAFNDEPAQVAERAGRFAHLQAQADSIEDTQRYLREAISAR